MFLSAAPGIPHLLEHGSRITVPYQDAGLEAYLPTNAVMGPAPATT